MLPTLPHCSWDASPPRQHREHLAGGGTPLPTVSGCRSRAEVQHFVLVSLSKPTKQKFPRGKPLIFECARMHWKPSQWKIPNQLHSTFTSPMKPLTREHASVLRRYLHPWSGGESHGMLRSGDAALSRWPSRTAPASPREVGWTGLAGCDTRRGPAGCCASFAPLFQNRLKCIC